MPADRAVCRIPSRIVPVMYRKMAKRALRLAVAELGDEARPRRIHWYLPEETIIRNLAAGLAPPTLGCRILQGAEDDLGGFTNGRTMWLLVPGHPLIVAAVVAHEAWHCRELAQGLPDAPEADAIAYEREFIARHAEYLVEALHP